MTIPHPTPVFRLIHIDNLAGAYKRKGIFAPNFVPHDGIEYRCIHHEQIQEIRANKNVPCGPGGVIHDYVPFYFGIMPPMLLALRDGCVQGYEEGQEPLIYLESSAQGIAEAGLGFVFTDGHGIMRFTHFFDDLSRLDQVHWDVVNQRYWSDTDEEPDRKRRKQAEFLVYRFFPCSLIKSIGVKTSEIQTKVQSILDEYRLDHPPVVQVQSGWYY